jgi:hypothetical protein
MIPLLIPAALGLIGGYLSKEPKKYHLGGDMSKHLAPNGKPSNLTHEQWHLVRTPEFKAWFGDWEKAYETGNYDGVSKVIDEDTKEPLVVYHGTFKKFTVFELSMEGGWFFTEFRRIANIYAETVQFGKSGKKNDTPIVLSCFLNIKKPNIIDYYGAVVKRVSTRIKSAKNKGFDGLIIKNALDIGGGNYEQYVSFHSNQIKLADGTNTTFDAENPDIRYAKGGKVDIVNIVDVKFDEKICQEWRFVRISEKKYDKIELYRKATWDDNKFYGDLLYRKVPKYIETFKSKMVNDRNQIFAFSGSNQAIANAVFEGKKPFGSLIEVYEKEDKDKSDKFFEDTISKCKELNIEYYLSKEEKWSNVNTRRYLQICHKGTFGELFDLEAFKNDYVSSKTLDKYTMIHIVDSIENRKLSYYLKDFRWDDTTPIIITGLILGIPLYFTMSIINSGHTYNLNKKYEY